MPEAGIPVWAHKSHFRREELTTWSVPKRWGIRLKPDGHDVLHVVKTGYADVRTIVTPPPFSSPPQAGCFLFLGDNREVTPESFDFPQVTRLTAGAV